jgi:hypothetical protein
VTELFVHVALPSFHACTNTYAHMEQTVHWTGSSTGLATAWHEQTVHWTGSSTRLATAWSKRSTGLALPPDWLQHGANGQLDWLFHQTGDSMEQSVHWTGSSTLAYSMEQATRWTAMEQTVHWTGSSMGQSVHWTGSSPLPEKGMWPTLFHRSNRSTRLAPRSALKEAQHQDCISTGPVQAPRTRPFPAVVWHSSSSLSRLEQAQRARPSHN